MAVNKVRVPVKGSIGKSVRLNAGTTTGGLTSAQVAAQIASAVAAIPAAASGGGGGGGAGTVTSVGLTAGSVDITITGASPITGSGSFAVDLSATVKSDLALAVSSIQAVTAGSADITVTKTTSGESVAVDLSSTVKSDLALAVSSIQAVTAGSADITVTKTTSGESVAVDLSSTVKSDLALAVSSIQAVTAGSTDITVTKTTSGESVAVDLSSGIKSAIAAAGVGTVTGITSSSLTVAGTSAIPTIDLTSTQIANLVLAAASVQPGAIQNMESAVWNSTSGAVQTALTVPQDILIPFACTLRELDIITQGGTGSCTVTINRAASSAGAIANMPPAVDITNGHTPAIASGTIHTDTAFTGWTTTTFTQNDILRLTLTANTGFTSIKVILRMY